jgi:small conductance mechanosensitive channel
MSSVLKQIAGSVCHRFLSKRNAITSLQSEGLLQNVVHLPLQIGVSLKKLNLQQIVSRPIRYGLLASITLILVSLMAVPGFTPSASAQLLGGSNSGGNSYSLGWVELDGYDTFQVAAPSSALSQRRQEVHENLEQIRDRYLDLENPVANLTATEAEDGQPQVYVNGQYLMTITEQDANLQGTTASGLVERLAESIPTILSKAYQQRQPEYRQRQYWIIGGVFLLTIAAMVAVSVAADRLLRSALQALGASLNQDEMTQNQRHQLQDLRDRLIPLVQGTLLASTLIWTLGRFPETRRLQQDLLSSLKIPIIIAIVIVVAYVGIRITYAVVDRVALGLSEDGFNHSRRTRLRISTLSSVTKNITNFVWIGIGFILALSITGVNLGLLLASVGIIGLALSLATQNLAQGAIKGFFIVLEDQFAIGDVVKIGDDAGVVEKLNLRITQLRDTAGRLITIPTSDIDRVANYSLHWSQADLKIPIHYNADVNQMLDVVRQVAEDLHSDPDWNSLIREEPQILGVDDFGDSALIIRVWIKTDPMKQWDISREFRRRFKQTLQNSETEIPFPQRDVWLHTTDELRLTLQGELDGPESKKNTNQDGNGQHPPVRTDAQPANVPDDGDGAVDYDS